MPEALKLAHVIAQYSPLVAALCKEAVNAAHELSLQDGLLFERRLFHSTFALVSWLDLLCSMTEKRAWLPFWRSGRQILKMNKIKPLPFALMEEFIAEGSAKIYAPKGQVFYNPVQQFNRDLSIVALSVFSLLRKEEVERQGKESFKGLYVLEALSATGLRSIRYSKEVPHGCRVVANDLDPDAVDLIRRNVELNGCQEGIKVHLGDANAAMHSFRSSGDAFDVIDLDPYGSSARREN